MTEFKRLAAHNSACNELFFIFQQCEKEHPIGRIFGNCFPSQKDYRNCLKEQRRIQQSENLEKAREKRRKLRDELAKLEAEKE